ncbi:hypothetical protein GBA52_005314 [Prunus armeniaca]|nr:hypothetical protein GBA52_005314 [Prunus armeniaca]
MADNTVFITPTVGSFSGSAVQMNTSTAGSLSSPGSLSGNAVRETGRHRKDWLRSHSKDRRISETNTRSHATVVALVLVVSWKKKKEAL